jgi:hypothetical protein
MRSSSRPETKARAFNERFLDGRPVALELDDGRLQETQLRSAAWVTGRHSAIAKVESQAGGWLISRIHSHDLS